MCLKELLEAIFDKKDKPMARAVGIDISKWQGAFDDQGNIGANNESFWN